MECIQVKQSLISTTGSTVSSPSGLHSAGLCLPLHPDSSCLNSQLLRSLALSRHQSRIERLVGCLVGCQWRLCHYQGTCQSTGSPEPSILQFKLSSWTNKFVPVFCMPAIASFLSAGLTDARYACHQSLSNTALSQHSQVHHQLQAAAAGTASQR